MDKKQCNSCQTDLAKDANFCGKCGNLVQLGELTSQSGFHSGSQTVKSDPDHQVLSQSQDQFFDSQPHQWPGPYLAQESSNFPPQMLGQSFNTPLNQSGFLLDQGLGQGLNTPT